MIGVVGHDAGAVEIISSHVLREGLDCIYCLDGPAVNVVARKLGKVPLLPLDALVEQCEWMLCGTSFLSDLEWRAIWLARRAGKRSVVVLDHWVNYRQRFVRNDQWNWPDEVWVGDETAALIAKEELPEVKQTLVPNSYFLDILDQISAMSASPRTPCERLSVLYVTEPKRDFGLSLYGNERHWGYTEDEALRYFLSNVEILRTPVNQIKIRPHPSESPKKYNWVKDEYDLPIVTGGTLTLIEEVAACDVVCGCGSMAMVVGLIAGRRVISCIPPGGKPSGLPHREIESMQSLVANRVNLPKNQKC